MLNVIKNTYLTNRFFMGLGGTAVLFALSFGIPILFPVAQTALALFGLFFVADLAITFNPSFVLSCKRKLPKVLSLSDENTVNLELDSSFNIPLKLEVVDELPIQFQDRDFNVELSLKPREKRSISYAVRPVERGEYHFNNVNIFASSPIGLVQKRHVKELKKTVPVYPSILQMEHFGLMAVSKVSSFEGIKKIRRLGHSYEFEQIKNYVKGDDYRSINWKATGRKNQIMVNQYEDERAQQVYLMIDKSRVMHMPFEGMSLCDYAINSSLAIANIALHKHDKAGLITFSDKIGTTIRAERTPAQLRKILNALYNEKERNLEANYELLYRSSRNIIKGRSLVFLFTNFESMYALERMLPILRKMNSLHLLVVVFFENTEITEFSTTKSEDLEGIYYQTVAQQYVAEKQQIVQKLRQHKIQTILTQPQDLSLNTINKYLELKARGMI